MKTEENTKFTFISNIPSNTIFFDINNEAIIKLKGNGEIYVKGKLIENDIEVVNGMRELLNRNRLRQIDMQNDIDELVEFIDNNALKLGVIGQLKAIKLIQKHTKI